MESLLLFEQLTDVKSNDFRAAIAIYETSFPHHERHPTSLIIARIEKGCNQLYVGRLSDSIVFIALLWPLKKTGFILLDYIATHADHQGKKIASGFLQYMLPSLKADRRYFILETEDPATGENTLQRQRRLDFYHANGAQQLNGVQYTLPALQGDTSTDMLLMIFPAYGRGVIESQLVKKLIVQIYEELYDRSADEALALSSGYIDHDTISLV